MRAQTGLRLLAEDPGDLEIIAAAAQDALVRVGDLFFDPKIRRFSALINRFRWEQADQSGPFERVKAAISFEGVLNVRSRKIRLDAPDAVAEILSISFTPEAEPPGGQVRIVLAGDGEILIGVECLDAVLADMGEPWRTPRKPAHDKPADGEG